MDVVTKNISKIGDNKMKVNRKDDNPTVLFIFIFDSIFSRAFKRQKKKR